MPTDHTVPCKARSSLKRLPFTGPCPTIRLSIAILMLRPSVAPSTGQQHDVTRFTCNGSSHKQALGHNNDSWTQRANLHAHDSLTHTLPNDDLHETSGTTPQHHLSHQRSSSSTALPATTPCRSTEHDHPSPCGQWCTRHLHPVASPTDDRPPRGDSTGRLPGASVA
jgi:hypothetical protein